MINRLAHLARTSPLGRRLVAWIFTHMNGLLPVEKMYESNLVELVEAGEPQLMIEMMESVRPMVTRFDLEHHGYRLIVNGGPCQDIPQVHFHLISENRE